MNGYQSYLKRMPRVIEDEVELSKVMGYNLGIKLVRGCYMTEEREIAAKAGKPSPVWDTIEETHKSYNKNALTVIENLEGNSLIMIASHNAETVELVTKTIEE